jgi:hypothetical protein
MATDQQAINQLNRPMMVMAILVLIAGLLLTISIALIWAGLPVMALGVFWIVWLFHSAKTSNPPTTPPE